MKYFLTPAFRALVCCCLITVVLSSRDTSAASIDPVVFTTKVPELVSGQTTATINMQASQPNIFSVDLSLSYSPTDATILEVKAGPITTGMTLASNTSQPGIIRTGIASASPLSGDGVILEIRIQSAEQPSVQINSVYVNEGAIPSVALATHKIEGVVRYYEGDKTVPSATLVMSGHDSMTKVAGGDGAYWFPATSGGAYTVGVYKATETPATRGVTTLDIALIRRHILALVRLDSPYKVLAADVNNSGSITTFDIAVIRRFILGLTDSLPAGLWQFVSSDVQFADPVKPWPYEETRIYTEIAANYTGQDFIGIKLGDVNGSWTPPANTAAATVESKTAFVSLRSNEAEFQLQSARPAVEFEIGKAMIDKPGALVTGPITVSGFDDVTSVQFTVDWDPTEIAYRAVSDYRLRGLGTDNFGTRLTDDGKLTVSWDDPEAVGQSVDDHAALFTISFRSMLDKGSVSSIRFTDKPTIREVTVNGGLAQFKSENTSRLFVADHSDLNLSEVSN